MNPWLIVSWIGAICVAVLIIAITVSILISVAGSARRSKNPEANAPRWTFSSPTSQAL